MNFTPPVLQGAPWQGPAFGTQGVTSSASLSQVGSNTQAGATSKKQPYDANALRYGAPGSKLYNAALARANGTDVNNQGKAHHGHHHHEHHGKHRECRWNEGGGCQPNRGCDFRQDDYPVFYPGWQVDAPYQVTYPVPFFERPLVPRTTYEEDPILYQCMWHPEHPSCADTFAFHADVRYWQPIDRMYRY